MKPILFILKMPFEDAEMAGTGDQLWFCTHCALIEGALAINPHWLEHIDLKRIDAQKPRQELIAHLGVDNQWVPVLILGSDTTITDPVAITAYLAKTYGGAAPHP